MFEPLSPSLPFKHGERDCRFELATFRIYWGRIHITTLNPNRTPPAGSMEESALRMLNGRGIFFFKIKPRQPQQEPYQYKLL